MDAKIADIGEIGQAHAAARSRRECRGNPKPLVHREQAAQHTRRDVSGRSVPDPGVFARLRSFAYNILRRNQNSTFSQDGYAAALAGLDDLFKWSVS
jgi:hypothetical protein